MKKETKSIIRRILVAFTVLSLLLVLIASTSPHTPLLYISPKQVIIEAESITKARVEMNKYFALDYHVKTSTCQLISSYTTRREHGDPYSSTMEVYQSRVLIVMEK